MKIYDNLQKIFEDEIFGPTDILIVWGKRGRGKSSLAGMFMSEFMRPRQARKDVKVANSICDKLNEAGFNLTPPQDHTVFCDTYFATKGFGRKKCSAYEFDGLDFGLPNEKHTTEVICPGGRYFLMRLKIYLIAIKHL